MATSIVMPQMGYDMQEGTVVRWYKQEGEAVARGEVIADIETDKATVEFEAYTSGVLRKIVVDAGIAIPVGQLIAVITDPDEALPDDLEGLGSPSSTSPSSTPPSSTPDGGQTADNGASQAAAATPTPPAPPAAAAPAGEVRASPIARRLAKEKGIDLTQVTGGGPGGRIVEQDVLDYQPSAAAPPGAPTAPTPAAAPENVDLSRMRQTIAKVTSDSKRDAPHFYVTSDIDMTKAMQLRRDTNDSIPAENRVSVNDMVIKAATIALRRHPKFNAFFRGDHLQMNPSVNMGIAIALDAGLIVPGISGCESKSLVEIAAASRDLIARANNGTLRNEEYSGTTFSISNLGMFDVDSFVAIIFPPHAAVLAVGRVKEQAVAREGQLAVAQMMKSTVSVDHRVADGAEAAQFLVEVKNLLENPVSLLLE